MEPDLLWAPPEPPEIWSNWNFDPPLLVALAILALVIGRDPRGLVAVTVLFIAFVSPLCALSSALFSARVVHHVLLTVVAAQLIGWYLPSRKARSVMLPFAVSTLVFWFWHAPAPYDRALSHIGIYWLMQIPCWQALFGSGVKCPPATVRQSKP